MTARKNALDRLFTTRWNSEALKRLAIFAGVMLALGCEGKDDVKARIEREDLESEVVELLAQADKANKEINSLQSRLARAEETAEYWKARFESLAENEVSKISDNAEVQRLRSANKDLAAEIKELRSKRQASESSNIAAPKEQPSTLTWTWEGNYVNNCGMFTIGGFPPGAKIALECHDPVIGRLALNGAGVDKAERLVFDPSTVRAVGRGEKGVRVQLCLFGIGGAASKVPSEWWKVTLVNK